ncbi:MAG: response regulator [Gammaproteobacteria bacterium]|nr:response regulator [Gammaproteobacteria bacterium]
MSPQRPRAGRRSDPARTAAQRPDLQGRMPRIHLLEGDLLHCGPLAAVLERAGFRVRVYPRSATLAAACAMTDGETPAAVVMGARLPAGAGGDGTLAAQLGSARELGIAVVVVTADDDVQTRMAGFRAGVARYLKAPPDPGRLTETLDELTHRQPTRPYRVVMVDPDTASLEAQAALLRDAGMAVQTVSAPLETLDTVAAFTPDVVVMEIHMEEASGPELAALLRERHTGMELPILFQSTAPGAGRDLSALRLGGDDCLMKPVPSHHLVAAVTARARRARQGNAVHRRLADTVYECDREYQALDHHALVSITDAKGDIIYANDRFCRVSGYHRDELLGQNHRIIKSGIHPPEFYEDLWRTIAGGGIWQGDICNRRKDGSLYWVTSTITPFLDDTGRPYQYVSIRTDITALKLAKDERSKLSRIAQETTNGVIITDAEGRVEWINAGFTRISGYGLEDMRGRSPGHLLQGEATDTATVRRMHEALAHLEPFEVDVVNYTKVGRPYWVHIACDPLHDDAGALQGFMAIQSDITEQVHAREALITARDEAQQANRAKSEFLSRMSHELRTPMNAILGFGQLLEYDPALSEDHRDNVREILQAGHHLLELINEVLDLSRIESGRLELSVEAVELCPVVEEALSLVAGLAQSHGIQMRHDGLAGVAVRADRMRLKQVLLNLLSNAVKYNRDGGRVVLTVRPVGGDWLRIQVEDTGYGIPAGRLSELFEPFRRLNAENSAIEGTGIGLTITRRIVEMMGGTVGVESEEGVGSTFWIELPREYLPEFDDDAGPGASEADGRPAGDGGEVATHTLLYIEDNPVNLKMVAQILGRRRNIRLHTAHLPGIGIELATAHHPDLILLDINMPDMDGYAVLDVLRARVELAEVPVVAITANAMPRDIRYGMAAGFTAYLTKPLDVTAFHEVLDRLLDGRPESVPP